MPGGHVIVVSEYSDFNGVKIGVTWRITYIQIYCIGD